MPIIIPKDIPAFNVLSRENIFVMTDNRAGGQDIRPIEILILNLMPTKIETETQLVRLLSNSPLQVNITLLYTQSHTSRNTEKSHLDKFYKTFSDVKNKKFDGLIITGAPVETLPFEEVNYWDELCEIMEFSKTQVTSTLYICWAAQAGLYYHYGISKRPLAEKLFGVYPHTKRQAFDPLLKGADDVFFIPHSRHTEISDADILACPDIMVLAHGEKTGCAVMKSLDGSKIFLTGHSEYDRVSLENEYLRDLNKGLKIDPPENYYVSGRQIDMRWASFANLLFANWLNYYVYQVTPFKLD